MAVCSSRGGVGVLAVAVAVGCFRHVGWPARPAAAGLKSVASDAARSAGRVSPEAAASLVTQGNQGMDPCRAAGR